MLFSDITNRKTGKGGTPPSSSTPANKATADNAATSPATESPAPATPAQASSTQSPGWTQKLQGQLKRPETSIPGVNAPTGQKKTDAASAPRRISMVELVQKLNPQPTQEQMEKENRRKKRERIFSAISDGISALSNLYFTTQYAPNMYSGRNTASERTENKWAQLAKERDANMNAYIRMLMNAQAADDAYARGEREWARQIGIDKVKAEKDAAEEKRDREKHELDMQLMGNKISESEYNAKVAEVEAKYASQLQEAKVERERAAAGASRASASASSARAENIRSGGDKYYGEFLGKSYKTRADYEKAVLDAAKKYGVNRYEYVRDGGSNLRPEYKVKDKSIEQIAAEVDALERKKQNKKPNPMGERTQSGKKPNPMS